MFCRIFRSALCLGFGFSSVLVAQAADGDPAVEEPFVDRSPPAVRIKSVNVRSQGGRYPFKFSIRYAGFDDGEIRQLFYRAAVDGRESGKQPYPFSPGTALEFDVDCHFFSVSLQVKDAAGKVSRMASFTADRTGDTNQFVITKRNPPVPPQELAASTDGGEVVLTWTDSSNDETGFAVQRRIQKPDGTFSAAWTTIKRLPKNATTFTDAKAASSRVYRYRVGASNAAGFAPGGSVEVTAP